MTSADRALSLNRKETPMTTATHRTANRRAGVVVRTNCAARRSELDPTFYPDIFAFRRAVVNGTVNPAKGCQTMDEYLASVSHGQV